MLALIKEVTKARRISRSFDRQVLIKTVFSALLNQTDYLDDGKQVLWIGCRLYTKNYYSAIERKGALVQTVDIDRTAKAYGKRDAHTLGSATSLSDYYAHGQFDVVFCNGVIGWGVDTPEQRQTCYREMRQIMKPRSLLVLGWNSHKTSDPLFNGDLAGQFSSVDLPGLGSRMIVPGTTHVFDMLQPLADRPHDHP